ncbi:MAG TPA: hypothetical protein VKT30_15440 [Caulobacteraceae bacterium]|nr:hypothetical protein [Caulobacteraceae bacterium]
MFINWDWNKDWWLIIIIAVLAVPVINAIFEPWRHYLRYRRQKDAIDVLKVYAAQNREPPPEVLDALRGRWIWRGAGRTARNVAENVTANVTASVGPSRGDRWDRRWDRWERRIELRAAGEPWRRWNWAIFTGAVTVGFGYAWRYAHANNDTFLIIAIVAGALTVAGVLSALVATFWRAS